MKGNSLKLVPAKGVDQSWKPPITSAARVLNMRYDKSSEGWVSDVGIENWWKFPNPFVITEAAGHNVFHEAMFASKVDSIFVWTPHADGGVTYHIIEQGGYLYYMVGNKGQGSSYVGTTFAKDVVIISSGRIIPKSSESPTQYVPYGEFLLILNGRDVPLGLSPRGEARRFSFTNTTSAPDVIPVQPGYQQGAPLQTGTGAPYFFETSANGLGSIDGDLSTYKWVVTTLTEAGSESPLSEEIQSSWKTASGSRAFRYGVVLTVPRGGPTTVSRRIYRTKNIRHSELDFANESIFYLVEQINENATTQYIDYKNDSQLVIQAPAVIRSQVIPEDHYTGASWDGRLWLADRSKVRFSNQGLFEEFSATSFYFADKVTALIPYYNNLLVFKADGIDVISPKSGGYDYTTLSDTKGTIASSAITIVPGVGVTFINNDGIWALSGSNVGGAVMTLRNISKGISKDLEDINLTALRKTVSAYSSKERELWVHYPSSTSVVPNKGAVYHLDLADWSFRKAYNKANENLFRFSAMATDLRGNFMLGLAPDWTNTYNQVGAMTNLFGQLAVWCRTGKWGQTATTTNFSGSTWTLSINDITKPVALWESSWISFGDNSMKYQVYSVELEVISQGDNPILLEYAIDYDPDFKQAPLQKQAVTERVGRTTEDPVIGPKNVKVSRSFFKIGETRLKDQRIVRLRFDVKPLGLCNYFKFRILTASPEDSKGNPIGTKPNTPFHLLTYSVKMKAKDIPVPSQTGRR